MVDGNIAIYKSGERAQVGDIVVCPYNDGGVEEGTTFLGKVDTVGHGVLSVKVISPYLIQYREMRRYQSPFLTYAAGNCRLIKRAGE